MLKLFYFNQDYLISDILPIYTVQKEGFKQLMAKINNKFSLRDKRYYNNMLYSRFTPKKKNLKEN